MKYAKKERRGGQEKQTAKSAHTIGMRCHLCWLSWILRKFPLLEVFSPANVSNSLHLVGVSLGLPLLVSSVFLTCRELTVHLLVALWHLLSFHDRVAWSSRLCIVLSPYVFTAVMHNCAGIRCISGPPSHFPPRISRRNRPSLTALTAPHPRSLMRSFSLPAGALCGYGYPGGPSGQC